MDTRERTTMTYKPSEVAAGQAWVLTLDGWNNQAAVVENGGRSFIMRDGGMLSVQYSGITAARRIWPES